jgi:predicted Zn-dependent peptidase
MNISDFTLNNGLRVLVARSEQSKAFDIAYHIDSGSRDETELNNGVSHFLEHMMFRGTSRLPNSVQLARELEGYGGECNAMTTQENTVYWLRGALSELKNGLSSFAQFVSDPSFSDLETEKNIVLQELENDYNEEGQLIDSESLGARGFFGSHALGLPIIGTRESLANLGKKELEEKIANFYHPKNCTLTISSQANENEIKDWVQNSFGTYFSNSVFQKAVKLPKNRFVQNGDCQKIVLQDNSDSQFNLKLMFQGSGGINSRVVQETFMQRILDDGIASRLPASIREEKGLVYDISCDASTFLETGYTALDATVSKDKFEDLVEEVLAQLLGMLSRKPTEEEMARTRFRYIFDLETMREQSSRMLSREVYNGFFGEHLSLDEEIQIVRSLTADDILKVSHRVLLSPLRSFVLVGPKARKKRNLLESFWSQLK